jgi:hypothetical protein
VINADAVAVLRGNTVRTVRVPDVAAALYRMRRSSGGRGTTATPVVPVASESPSPGSTGSTDCARGGDAPLSRTRRNCRPSAPSRACRLGAPVCAAGGRAGRGSPIGCPFCPCSRGGSRSQQGWVHRLSPRPRGARMPASVDPCGPKRTRNRSVLDLPANSGGSRPCCASPGRCRRAVLGTPPASCERGVCRRGIVVWGTSRRTGGTASDRFLRSPHYCNEWATIASPRTWRQVLEEA